MKNLDRKVTLICNICGNDQFALVEESTCDLSDAPDTALIKCSDCGNVLTKESLIFENTMRINENVEEMKKEAVDEIEKELKRMLKKFR